MAGSDKERRKNGEKIIRERKELGKLVRRGN